MKTNFFALILIGLFSVSHNTAKAEGWMAHVRVLSIAAENHSSPVSGVEASNVFDKRQNPKFF